MDTKEKYLAKSLAWSIKSDYDFIKWLVDTRNFSDSAIKHPFTRVLFRASVVAYAKLAPVGRLPSLDDVTLELSKIAGEDAALKWHEIINKMERPELGQQRDVANALAEEYDRRRVIGYVEDWVSGAKGGEVSGSISSSFTNMYDGVVNMLVGSEASGKPKDIIQAAREEGAIEPESTGYSRLDKGLSGGFFPRKFYVWGMPSGHGKTSACCNLAARRCEQQMPTIIHSMEMPSADLAFRILCDLAHVTLEVAENPEKKARSSDEIARVRIAEDLINEYLRIYDAPADAQEMERRIRRHKAEFEGATILSEIDHIGIVRRDSRGSDWSELESMAYSLVNLAKNMKDPVLAFSQVPDEMENELTKNNIVVYNKDFRGSRGIRNAVDVSIVGCKHSGVVEDHETGRREYDHSYMNHTVIQITKDRRHGKQFWGVFQYEPEYYRLTNSRHPGTREDIT